MELVIFGFLGLLIVVCALGVAYEKGREVGFKRALEIMDEEP